MDVLTIEAWPAKQGQRSGSTPHPYVLKAITAVRQGEVVRFDETDLKVMGFKKMLGLEQALRRQAAKVDIKLSVWNMLDKNTGARLLWVRRASNDRQ